MRTVFWLAALVAHVTAKNSCTDDLKQIQRNAGWFQFEASTESSNQDEIKTMTKCLNSVDSVCDKKKVVIQKKGIDTQRKHCMSDVPNAKHHSVKTVMCRDRLSLKDGVNSVDLHMFICAPTSCDPKFVGDILGCAFTSGLTNLTDVVCASEFIYCDLCNGCFVDQTAYFLNISSPVALVLYIAIASVILGFLGGIILYCVLRKNMTKKASNPEEWKQKILDFYKENNPEKLEDTGTLEMLFAKYKGQERPLYNMIRKKYDARQNTATETELASPSHVPTDLEYNTQSTPLLEGS